MSDGILSKHMVQSIGPSVSSKPCYSCRPSFESGQVGCHAAFKLQGEAEEEAGRWEAEEEHHRLAAAAVVPHHIQ